MSEKTGWQEEMQSAYLYRVMAEKEAGTPQQKLFAGLAAAAERQASLWLETTRKQGKPFDHATGLHYRPDLRARTIALLIRLLGPRHMRPALAAMKIRGLSIYSSGLAPVTEADGHAMPTSASSGADERRHRGLSSGGNLRAAVFGVNDGLVSNASLIMGVAGATMQSAEGGGIIVLSGLAGMLAGAFSMAAGEYISMRSQREMFEHQIGLEREELAEYPEEEAAELALIYEARGVEKAEASRIAAAMIADPVKGLDTLAREELGLNPDELGSPWGAASFSFMSFCVGAIIPLAPFLLMTGTGALYTSIGLTAVSLFGVGATLSLFTGRRAGRRGR